MHLRSVSLRDWKAYEAARFDFPEPDGDRNVILIGGQNGFGKTTLFEAIALGLYGAYGLPLISRAAAAADEQNRGQSFRAFIERALNGHASVHARSCSLFRTKPASQSLLSVYGISQMLVVCAPVKVPKPSES